MRPWEIARLTDTQINQIYFAPRDDEGNLVIEEEESKKPFAPKLSYKELCFKIWQDNGATEEQCQKQWEKLEEEKKAKKKGTGSGKDKHNQGSDSQAKS